MILAVLIDGDGRPVCSEMWPGNTADVTALVPVIDRLRKRFAIGRVCIVADRGMISTETITALEARGLLYILGVRERTDKLVRDVVINDAAPFVPLIVEKRGRDIEYSAKAVTLGGARYIVCINHQQAEKDAADRAAVLAALERQLKRGDKALVGNTGSLPGKPYRQEHANRAYVRKHVNKVEAIISGSHAAPFSRPQ